MRTEIDGIAVHCRYDKIAEIGELTEHPKNPNTHPNYQLERLAEIIRGTGWRQPITISGESGFIVKGHGRYQAAKLAGFKQVPVEVQHYDSDEQELADLIADNRMAELAVMDKLSLGTTLQELQESGIDAFYLTGYSATDLDALMAQAEAPDFDHIEELLQDGLGGAGDKPESDIFSVSFNFPKETQADIEAYIKQEGKEAIAQMIMREAGCLHD